MLTVWINGQEREGIDEGWIANRVQGLRRDGETVCVRVTAKGDDADIAVSAGICPAGSPGGRRPTRREQQLFEMWDGCGLRSSEFPPGQLIQCLKRLDRAL